MFLRASSTEVSESKSTTSVNDVPKNPNLNVYKNLIAFGLHQCGSDMSRILTQISFGWEWNDNMYKSKNNIFQGAKFKTLQEVLMYIFEWRDQHKHSNENAEYSVSEFLRDAETTKRIENIYQNLIHSLTLRQKAYLFSIGTDRRNRRYHVVHEYKDCIVGKDAVDWMIDHFFALSRADAVCLGQQFVENGFMQHVTNDHNFLDADFWYEFNDDLIQKQAQKNGHYNEEKCIQRFKKHNEIMQSLVTMTVTPKTEFNVLLDVQKSFYLPSKGKKSHFICKHVDNLFFDTMIEAIFCMLTNESLWHRIESQNIFNKLMSKLTLTQQAMLCSIGCSRKDRRYRLKNYSDCFVGRSAVKFMKRIKMVNDDSGAINLGNMFIKKGYIKHVCNEHNFKNEKLFFVFLDNVISTDLMKTTYKEQQTMHNQQRRINDNKKMIGIDMESKQISFEQSKGSKSQSITPMDMTELILECEPEPIRTVKKNKSIIWNNELNMEHSVKRNSVSMTIGKGISSPPSGMDMKTPTLEQADSVKITQADVKDLAIYQSLVYGNNQLILKVNQSNTVLQHNLNQIDLAHIAE